MVRLCDPFETKVIIVSVSIGWYQPYSKRASLILQPNNLVIIFFQDDIHHQWAVVFYMTAGINALGMSFYLCFASAKKQPWAD